MISSNPSQTSESDGKVTVTELVVQTGITLLCTALLLRIWKTDIRVPFNYWGDTVFELALVKSIADQGWIWFIARLGAPFGLDIVAFPQNLTISSLMMKAIATITSEPGLILNLFWISSIALTSVVCKISMRLLGISRNTSFVASILYALMPYALYRNTAHISLTYIFVPIIAAFSIAVLADARRVTKDRSHLPHISVKLILVASVGIGFDYIYNAFFACFFLACAGFFGVLSAGTWTPIRRVAPIVSILIVFATINVLPSLLNWHEMGIPPRMDYKSPAEAETYGLKIRHVISPLSSNALNKAPFPLENENQFSKLGIVGAIGFISAIVFGLIGGIQKRSELMWATGTLTLAGVLLATIGGFGSVFNSLISPDIRAYNRIIVFLGFFSFFILSVHLDSIRTALQSRNKSSTARFLYFSILVITLTIGLIDQGKAARPIVEQYKRNTYQMRDEIDFVMRVEKQFPLIESIYQLPQTSFPPDGGRERMLPYDHGRPFLWSKRLRWSWPNFSQKRQGWEDSIGKPGTPEFTTNLAISDFSAIWLDRHGYTSSELSSLEGSLAKQLGPAIAQSNTGRYVLFSLTRPLAMWQEVNTKEQQDHAKSILMNPNRKKSID